jgi:hypothetical protein
VNTEAICRELRQVGGYAITHTGRITHKDGKKFSTSQLEEMLNYLHYYLSFVLGRWAGPELTVGYDQSDVIVFQQMGLSQITDGAWQGSSSWFEDHSAEMVREVSAGFWELWQTELWRKPLREAIYLYVGANRTGRGLNVDTALLLSQSALELLSWNYCVKDRKMLSEVAYKPGKLSASDKLRVLATTLGIPVAIPTSLPAFHTNASRMNWRDIPDAITDLRNSLVHPDNSKKYPERSWYDAWRASLHMIELVLLRLCGHTGKYSNRITKRFTGQIEDVPWK